MSLGPEPAELPRFPVEVSPPDLGPWRAGNIGIEGFSSFAAPQPGPHVLITALVHGNEIAGAIVLQRMLARGVRPRRGRLTLGLCNLAAFDRFDPAQPTASRFIDEDLNRVWAPATLDGPRRSAELDRARRIRPVVEEADVLLDLHSMLWPSDPLMLSGPSAQGQALALALGVPGLVVADHGHQTGPRLIDYPRFTAPGGTAAGCLLEAGQHWRAATVTVMECAVDALLRHTRVGSLLPVPSAATRPRCAEVTLAVTATTSSFAFVQPFRGGEVIPRRNTLIALDGTTEIRTPHDECLLIMPSLRASRGHTAVRLARYLPDDARPTDPRSS